MAPKLRLDRPAKHHPSSLSPMEQNLVGSSSLSLTGKLGQLRIEFYEPAISISPEPILTTTALVERIGGMEE
jgi:hypothetical protein